MRVTQVELSIFCVFDRLWSSEFRLSMGEESYNRKVEDIRNL